MTESIEMCARRAAWRDDTQQLKWRGVSTRRGNHPASPTSVTTKRDMAGAGPATFEHTSDETQTSMKHRGCPGEIANGGGWDRPILRSNKSQALPTISFGSSRGRKVEATDSLSLEVERIIHHAAPILRHLNQRPAVVPGIMPRREAGTRPIAHRHPHTYLHRALLTNQRQCAALRGAALSRLKGGDRDHNH